MRPYFDVESGLVLSHRVGQRFINALRFVGSLRALFHTFHTRKI
jgi:hypothetical protein